MSSRKFAERASLCRDSKARPFLIPAPKEEDAKSTATAAKDSIVDAKNEVKAKVKSDQPNATKFIADLAAGGTAGGVSKTVVAPIERVKLLLQTQDGNPRIKSGEIPRYTG